MTITHGELHSPSLPPSSNTAYVSHVPQDSPDTTVEGISRCRGKVRLAFAVENVVNQESIAKPLPRRLSPKVSNGSIRLWLGQAKARQ